MEIEDRETYEARTTASALPHEAMVYHELFTRGQVPFAVGNTNCAALLDVYRLIGEPAMADAFRAVRPLGARYGEPLPAAAQQAFVDRAPAGAQPQVRDLVARIIF